MSVPIQGASRIKSVLSDVFIIVGLVLALTRSNDIPLPATVNNIYPVVFVGVVFVFFASGYVLLLHNGSRLKKIHNQLAKASKWQIALPALLLGTVHIAVMIGLLVFHPAFVKATPEGSILSQFSFWMLVIVTIVACTLPAIVLESIEYTKNHMKWVERVHSKFPMSYAIAYATMSILMPVFAWGTIAWVIKRTNIVTKNLANGAKSFLSTSLETSFGFLIAIVLAFETYFVRITDGATSIGELLWPTLLVFFLLYLPFKWFITIADESHDKKYDIVQSILMIIIQITIVLLLA